MGGGGTVVITLVDNLCLELNRRSVSLLVLLTRTSDSEKRSSLLHLHWFPVHFRANLKVLVVVIYGLDPDYPKDHISSVSLQEMPSCFLLLHKYDWWGKYNLKVFDLPTQSIILTCSMFTVVPGRTICSQMHQKKRSGPEESWQWLMNNAQ